MKCLALCMLGLFVTAFSGHTVERQCVGFRESDPASYVRGVSVIQGNFIPNVIQELVLAALASQPFDP
jgi:hypothetical protein